MNLVGHTNISIVDLMYYFIYVVWFVFPVAINSVAPTLDNLHDLQEEDFEQFKEQGK
jgi:hypothetical protein